MGTNLGHAEKTDFDRLFALKVSLEGVREVGELAHVEVLDGPTGATWSSVSFGAP